MMNSKQIINDVKNNFNELTYTITYQDNIPVNMVGYYINTPLFVINFSDGTINFETLYNNTTYKTFIKTSINDAEKFLIESGGVSFYYHMNKGLLQQLIPKIILSFKKYYILNKKETISYDFCCGRRC